MHLFTINAASHVHVSVSPEEAVPAVNVLNGFTGAQIALTAHSNVWRGRLDPEFKCVAEKFWDWWMPQSDRVGVPMRPFKDLEDYVHAVSEFSPVFVKRDGIPIVPKGYETFREYCHCEKARGETPDGREVVLEPAHEDFDLHCTCYWFNARLSRYYTVENRVNDQQPPEDLPCIAAITLGLMEALPEAGEALAARDWDLLRRSREIACRDALLGQVNGTSLTSLARDLLDVAGTGLRRRGKGEEIFLERLADRLQQKKSPADDMEAMFREGGIAALVEARSL
jgi:gamma-glutamylcysteine synthetase